MKTREIKSDPSGRARGKRKKRDLFRYIQEAQKILIEPPDWEETCPYTVEPLADCSIRRNRNQDSMCPFILEYCSQTAFHGSTLFMFR